MQFYDVRRASCEMFIVYFNLYGVRKHTFRRSYEVLRKLHFSDHGTSATEAAGNDFGPLPPAPPPSLLFFFAPLARGPKFRIINPLLFSSSSPSFLNVANSCTNVGLSFGAWFQQSIITFWKTGGVVGDFFGLSPPRTWSFTSCRFTFG